MDSNPDSDHLSHVDCDPDSNPDSGPGARVNAALDGKVSFYSRMKLLVDNLLRLNTEECRLVIVETEFEAICCLLKQRCRLQTDRMNE